MKKVIGGRDKSCDYCGGTMLIIIINGQKYYQCVNCGAMTKSFPLEEVRIIKEEEYVQMQ